MFIQSTGNISFSTTDTGSGGIFPPSSSELIEGESDSPVSVKGGPGGKTALIDLVTAENDMSTTICSGRVKDTPT